MGGAYNKQKGANFERQTCKRLSLWASHLTRDDIFWRSAMSGGRATFKTRQGRDQKAESQSGDISAIHPLGYPLISEFFLECKHLKNLHLDIIPYGGRGELKDYWEEPWQRAKDYDKTLLVIAKENRRHPIVLTTKDGSDTLKLAIKPNHKFTLRAYYPTTKPSIFVYMFRDMLANLSYEKLVEFIEKQ